MVRLINKNDGQKRYQESEEEKKERLQRELDFAGEFEDVRKSNISAAADRLISDSRPKNPLRFVKLFNQIEEGNDDHDVSVSTPKPNDESPRKKQKSITKPLSSISLITRNNVPKVTHRKKQEDVKDIKEVEFVREEVKQTKSLPQLVKFDDNDSFIDIEDDSLLETSNIIDIRGKLDSLKTTKLENNTESPKADDDDDEEEENDEFFDASDKPQGSSPAKANKSSSDSSVESVIENDDISDNLKYGQARKVQEASLNDTLSSEKSTKQVEEKSDNNSTIQSTQVTDQEILNLKVKLYSKLTGRSDLIPYGLEAKYNDIYRLLEATVKDRESQSAFVIGPKNSGKTRCLDVALRNLRSQVKSQQDDFIIIKISGLTQENDKMAVKSIARQLDSEISRVYKVNVEELESSEFLAKKSITETFANILNILDKRVLLEGDSEGRIHIPIVFVIDEVEVYANQHRQTLLYNLFDLVENSSTPITTVCLSSKVTVKDMLEKRVRSRFSQRMIQFQKYGIEQFVDTACKILSVDIPENEYENKWNEHIQKLISGPSSLRDLIIHNHLTVNNFKDFHNHCTYPISQITINQPFVVDKDFEKYFKNQKKSSLKNVINSLSEIEIALLISAARLVIKNDLNWINLNATYEEYQVQAKTQNKNRSSNVFNTSAINTGFKIWPKERCEAPWEALQRLGLLIPPTSGGKSGKTLDFSNNTVETKMWQLEVTLDELRFIVDSDKNVKSWTRL